MPRRHIISAAGALAAALLVAAQAPANAQTAPGQPSRATPGAGQDQAAGTADSLGGWESTTIPEPLGGMGDEPPEAPSRALGGLGDEPSEAALQPEEESRDLLQPEETGIPVKALGLSPPPTGQSALGQINTALLPEPHDLDPFVPLGIRLGSFLLFPETGSRRRSDQQRAGHEVRHPDRLGAGDQAQGSPRFRLGPALFGLRGQCRSPLVHRVSDRRHQELSGARARAARRDVAHEFVGRNRKVAHPRELERDHPHRHRQRQHRARRAACHGGSRSHLQPAKLEAHRHGRRLRLCRRHGPGSERRSATCRYQRLPRHDGHVAQHL